MKSNHRGKSICKKIFERSWLMHLSLVLIRKSLYSFPLLLVTEQELDCVYGCLPSALEALIHELFEVVPTSVSVFS